MVCLQAAIASYKIRSEYFFFFFCDHQNFFFFCDLKYFFFSNLRKRTGYASLVKKVAQAAVDNEDPQKAIPYYVETMENYIKERKNNEARYVTEVLGGLYQELGEFPKSRYFLEKALIMAGSFGLSGNVTMEKMDQIKFRSTNPKKKKKNFFFFFPQTLHENSRHISHEWRL
jgi:hypothetical protein